MAGDSVRVLSEEERAQLMALRRSYDKLPMGYLMQAVERFIENGFDPRRLEQLLEHPRAFRAALETACLQRPLVNFESFVRRTGDGGKSLEGLLSRRGAMLSLLGVERAGDRSVTAQDLAGGLSHQLEALAPPRGTFRDQIEGFLSLFGREALGAAEIDTVPVVTLDFANPANTCDRYVDLLSDPATGLVPTDKERVWEHMTGTAIDSAVSAGEWAPGARLVRLGLAFQSTGAPSPSIPRKAEFAGVEFLATILRYPYLLSWLRLHPEGGYRAGDRFRVWMRGCERSLPVGGCATYLTLSVTFDAYGRPWVDMPRHEPLSAFDPVHDAAAYFVPVRRWSRSDLLAMIQSEEAR